MRTIETDYLVVGAGASAMAFVDEIVTASDAEVVMVDRRARPGGHWLDAYPFVRLHQPSSSYGVSSRQLGLDRIEEFGPNAGFYERASAPEIVDYYGRILDETFLPSGRVHFLGKHDYRCEDNDGHHVVSLVTGEQVVVTVRRKVVDATYIESTIPSRHTPSFSVEDDVRVIPPNGLVNLAEPASGFTVLGGGKTAMDTCVWLLEQGVDPDAIRWLRPRDSWCFDRGSLQPLELVASLMEFQANWVEASAEANDAHDWFHRMEAAGGITRFDPHIEPTMFHGAVVSEYEMDLMRSIERIVRSKKAKHIASTYLGTDDGDIATDAGQVYVDCTASGVGHNPVVPVFERDRITLQYIGAPPVPYAAAQAGFVETLDASDDEKNALCPPLTLTTGSPDITFVHGSLLANMARMSNPDLNAWTERTRLNMARGVMARFDDPAIGPAIMRMGAAFGPALANTERLLPT